MIRRAFLSLALTLGLASVAFGIGYAPVAALRAQQAELAHAWGRFTVECWKPDGTLRWREGVPNVVTIVGKNLMLDTAFEGSAYTATGPFMGLISATAFGGTNASDTMVSHLGWLEAGATNAPTYFTPRKTPTWSASAGGLKQTATPVQFIMSGTGTLAGVFLVYGTGATNTIDNTGGVLYSAGTFLTTHGVTTGDLVKVSYTTGL